MGSLRTLTPPSPHTDLPHTNHLQRSSFQRASCEHAEGLTLTTIMHWHIKQEQASYLSDSLHPPECIQAHPSDWSGGRQDCDCQTELQLGGSNSKAQMFGVTMTSQVTELLIPK